MPTKWTFDQANGRGRNVLASGCRGLAVFNLGVHVPDGLTGGFFKETGKNRVDQGRNGRFEQGKAETKREFHVLAICFADRSGVLFEGGGQVLHVGRSFAAFRTVCCMFYVNFAQILLSKVSILG